MDKNQILWDLKVIVTPYAQDAAALDNISETTDFIKDLKINSANLVDVVLDIEEKFGIEIDNEAMAKMLDVSTAIQIIEEKLA
jgi:acyl carrier protein